MISSAVYSDEFVGRQEERSLLNDEFRFACEGRVRFVSIEGEAGIGKSRLVGEFLDELETRAAVATGYCSEHVRSPYLPFTAILERLEPRKTLALHTSRERRPRSEERAAYYDAVARMLRRESAKKPLVVVIEDVQWADSATIELLRFFLQYLGSAHVLFLVTMRTENAERNVALAGLRNAASRARSTAILLRGLRRNEIRHLVQRSLRARRLDLPGETVSHIEALSEGNPLFAEELARIAVESGGLTLQTHVPLSVQALLGESLAHFSESERDVLVLAAIIGQTFDAPFLASIAQCELTDVLAVMQRAVRRGIVVGSSSRSLTFSFRHALIRQALADRLLLALAAPLHVRIAREIEAQPDASARAAELAYHWSAAHAIERARTYNEAAAQIAWNVNAYRDAIRFYSAALRWDYPPGPERAAVYERLGTLLYIDGCGEEPARWLIRCREEYEALGDPVASSHALLLLADQYWVDARTFESLQAASEAAAVLERLGQNRMLALARLSIARFCVTLGDAPEARVHLRSAERLRAHFDLGLRALFQEVRAEIRAALGEASGALRDGRVASKLAAQSGVSDLIAQIENNYALVAADLGELDLAIERHRVAVAEAHRTGMAWRVAYSSLGYANTLVLKGELREARALVAQALDTGVDTATFKTKAASVGIPLALLLNDRALLEVCCDEGALEQAYRSREIQRIGCVSAAFAQVRAAQGAEAQARELLARALRSVRKTHRCWELFAVIGAIGSPQDLALARTVLSGSAGRPRMLRAHALLLGALEERRQNLARSQRLAGLARSAFGAMGWRLAEAYALELTGDVDGAMEAYRVMGDVRDFERLRQSGAPKERRVAALTSRQAQIAELVARGDTNRAIAERLHISENTVEHHLSSIFARLKVKSRAALTAHVVARRPAEPGMAEIRDTIAGATPI